MRTWRNRVFFASATLGVVLASASVWAASSQVWRHRTRTEREQGDLKGVSLLKDGALTLGSGFETVAKSPDPYLWSLARDSRGSIYAGTGNDGKVYRLEKGGELRLLFDSQELEVHALAVDSKDNLYVGTSTKGKIYRVDPTGRATEFFAPEETYIWSLVFDRKGNLYAGTGTQGKIYKIPPSGKGEVFLDTDETHVRVLAVGPDGNLLAGTDGKGLLLGIDSEGRSRVIANSPLGEVTALVLGPSGRIYFAAAGQAATRPAVPRPAPPAAPRPSQTPPSVPEEERPPGQPPENQPPPAPQPPPTPPTPPPGSAVESRILEVEKDGYAREIWTGSGDLILSLAQDREGNLVAGAGTDGKIYRIDAVRADATLMNKADSAQVTVLLPEPGGSILAGGSNLGALYRLGGKVAAEGTYESAPFDARVYSIWGRVMWHSETPPGSSVRIQLRTGNTSDPDATWSEWSALYDQPDGSVIDRPRARYVQWRAILKSDDGRAVPRLGEVAVNFLQRNLPPEVKAVDVQAPGVVYQKPNKAGGAGSSPGEGSTATARSDRDKTARRQPQQPRPQGEREGRAVQWTATDPNGDDLLYSVYYRGVDEKEWKLMEENLTDAFFSWDATSMADGTYLLRVAAEDSPSNPSDASLTAERLSDPFDIDNNPPRIDSIKAAVSGSNARLEFNVSDSFSVVGAVEYSVNAREWQVVYPVDGISDSNREEYRVELSRLPGGEVTVVVRANDAAGNSASAKAVFQVAGAR